MEGSPGAAPPPCPRGWSHQAQRGVGVCLTPLSEDASAISGLKAEREAAVWVLPPIALLTHFLPPHAPGDNR